MPTKMWHDPARKLIEPGDVPQAVGRTVPSAARNRDLAAQPGLDQKMQAAPLKRTGHDNIVKWLVALTVLVLLGFLVAIVMHAR